MRIEPANDGNGSVPSHLDDSDLISYLDGELGRAEQDAARVHLEGCWNCRSRLLAVQNSIENFLRTRKQIIPDEFPPANVSLAQFRRRLAQHQKAPATFRFQMLPWLQSLRMHSDSALRALLMPMVIYKKTVFASALALLAVAVFLFDPFKWRSASADELMTRASAYESLNETRSGKVIRTRSRLDRINLSTKAEKYLGQIETDVDSLTQALHVSRQSASGASHAQTLRSREKLNNVEPFISDFNPDTAKYLSAQGWLPEVSVSLYQRLIERRGFKGNEGASANKRGSIYEVHHAFAPAHSSHITETVLTINAKTYAPQGVSVFTSDGNDRLEYRLTRVSFESIERTPEVATLFELPSAATSKTTAAANERETRNSKREAEGPERETARSKLENASAASADLEVEVLLLLHQAGADLGEQVSVSRTAGGPVRVSGILETDQRKSEILRALQPVANNRAVRIEVKTVAEAIGEPPDKQSTPGSATVEGVEVAADTFPAYHDLRERMSDEEARVFAARIVSRSHSAMRHAWALKRLMWQFSASELATLQPDAHAKWIALIQSHAREFAQENAALRQQLQPIFGAGSQAGSAGESEIKSGAEVMQTVERLVTLASTNYELVRSAFTITRESAQVTAIKSPQFWQLMRNAEALAQAIERAR